jgi:hypothetical protein
MLFGETVAAYFDVEVDFATDGQSASCYLCRAPDQILNFL